MTKYRLKKTKTEESIVNAYKKMEENIVKSYSAVEHAVVGTYRKVEDKFVDTFLEEEKEEEASPLQKSSKQHSSGKLKFPSSSIAKPSARQRNDAPFASSKGGVTRKTD